MMPIRVSPLKATNLRTKKLPKLKKWRDGTTSKGMKRIDTKSRGMIRIIQANVPQSGGPSSQFTGTGIGFKYPQHPKTETKALTTE